jgi:ATP-binding cassette, subfamily C, bacterial exporter for protease/lipase
VFVISHRSSILPVVDKMLALDEGRLVAFGPRDEVRARLREAQAGRRLQLVATKQGTAANPP